MSEWRLYKQIISEIDSDDLKILVTGNVAAKQRPASSPSVTPTDFKKSLKLGFKMSNTPMKPKKIAKKATLVGLLFEIIHSINGMKIGAVWSNETAATGEIILNDW